MSGHVFLSYSRSDRRYVARLAAHLTHAGIAVLAPAETSAEVLGPDADGRLESRVRDAIAHSAAVVAVLTSGSVSSERVRAEISDAIRAGKPILGLRLEPYPANEIPMLRGAKRMEDVIGGRMPSQSFVDELGSLSTPAPNPSTAEVIARYTPTRPTIPTPAPHTPAPATAAPDSRVAPAAPPAPVARRRPGATLLAAIGVAAALATVWLIADRLPKVQGAPPAAARTPANSAAAAVSAFIAAAEVRDRAAISYHVCGRYQGVTWYESDFYAPNFIQAKISVITSQADSATANVELFFQVEGESQITGRQYLVVQERGAWKVCGPP